MLLPESMSRIVIVGTKTRMQDAINAFYSERAIHVIDHTTGDDGLSIGSPSPNTSKASERLLKIRAMEKELGIKKKTKTASIAVEDVQERIQKGDVESVEDEVLKAADARNDLTQKITELNAKKTTYELLKRLPLTLDLYSGYKSLDVLVGTTAGDASKLQIDGAEVFCDYKKKEGSVVAVFVKKSQKAAAAAALSDIGFVEMQVPGSTEKVTADQLLVETESEIANAEKDLGKVDEDLEALKTKYMSFLKGSDEELSIEIEKGSLPLRIAVSKYAYVMDAWVPTKKVDTVKADLEQKLGDDIYVEFQETRDRKLASSEAAEPRFKDVPTKQNNGKITSEFEYATSLVAVPKYQEIDPTILIMIFLPLFFGYMVGDLGYAIPFIIIGAYGIKKTHHKDWRSIAIVFFFGGIWAAIFGLFFYGEMLGMHFIGGYYDSGDNWRWFSESAAVGGVNVSWDWILGVHFPQWFLDLFPQVGFENAAEIAGTAVSGASLDGYGIGKLEDVGFLLKLAVYIGIVHLLIGHFCGLVNIAMQRGKKAAFIGKGGMIIGFVGMISLCYALTDFMFNDAEIMEGITGITLVVGIVMLVIGLIINTKAEGAMQAVMAMPEYIGQVLSYARLAAIAMSKAGMALAFNYIIFSMMMPTHTIGTATVIEDGAAVTKDLMAIDWSSGIIMVALGIVVFCFLHLVVWMLAILSAGIHALRLQFVELMLRFYDGGGERYSPLSEKRVKTFFSRKAENIKEV